MDIKLRKYRKMTAIRVLIFILCVASFTTALVGTVLMANSFNQIDYEMDVEDILRSSKYEESLDLQKEILNEVNGIKLLLDYKSED